MTGPRRAQVEGTLAAGRGCLTVAMVIGLTGCPPGFPPPDPIECEPLIRIPDVSTLVSVYSPMGIGRPILIDATEVTQGQYRRFLEATDGGTDTTGQPGFCAWNATFAPSPDCYADIARSDELVACDHQPQTCVDWCDALMYCQWAGKRLCGRIRDGSLIPLGLTVSLDSEWYVACSSGTMYPYSPGLIDDAHMCNTLDCARELSCPYSPGGTRVLPPGSMPSCQSPHESYGGVYDLTGNVWEWENACDGMDGAADRCAFRGGSVSDGGSGVRCDTVPSQARAVAHVEVGFRCCADPP